MTIFYRRSGERIARAKVEKAKAAFVLAKRFGAKDPIPLSAQPAVADSIERLTLEQYCDWSGCFTFKKTI